MLPYSEPPSTAPDRRPVVSDVGPNADGGKSFTVTFKAGQELPTHRNASRILIQVHDGAGTVVVDEEPPVELNPGDLLQIAPNAPHSVRAGEAGLEIEVHLVSDCCSSC